MPSHPATTPTRSVSAPRVWCPSGAGEGDPVVGHRACLVLDYDQDMEAADEDGADVGEVNREHRVGLRGKELSLATST
jgi:hypothetical protein